MSIEAFNPVEASIEQTLQALDDGRVTSVELVQWCLDRAARIDRDGPKLNAIPVLNTHALDEARASDERRARGEAGALEGVPFTVKTRTW